MNSWNIFVSKFKNLGYDINMLSKIYKHSYIKKYYSENGEFPNRKTIVKVGDLIMKHESNEQNGENNNNVCEQDEKLLNKYMQIKNDISHDDKSENCDRLTNLQNSVDYLITLFDRYIANSASKEKFSSKVVIAPGEHVLLPSTSKLSTYMVTLQRRWTMLAFELNDKLNNLNDKTYLENYMSEILVRIWTLIDNYLLNQFYKTMTEKRIIKRFMIIQDTEITDSNILNKVEELQTRASIDQTTEYIVPVIGVIRKEINNEIENHRNFTNFNSQNEVLNESYEYLFYLVFNIKKILEELEKPFSYSIHAFTRTSLQSVLGQPPTSIVELPCDPESDENDPSLFEKQNDISELTSQNVLWKLVLMCIHAIAHVNTFLDKGYNMRRGCEHDDLFNQQLMLMFPMTFMNAKFLPNFVKNVMNLSNIAHRY